MQSKADKVYFYRFIDVFHLFQFNIIELIISFGYKRGFTVTKDLNSSTNLVGFPPLASLSQRPLKIWYRTCVVPKLFSCAHLGSSKIMSASQGKEFDRKRKYNSRFRKMAHVWTQMISGDHFTMEHITYTNMNFGSSSKKDGHSFENVLTSYFFFTSRNFS